VSDGTHYLLAYYFCSGRFWFTNQIVENSTNRPRIAIRQMNVAYIHAQESDRADAATINVNADKYFSRME
jgi:hypothetical protein